MIYQDNLTISTNLFGTTYYSLVGLHATHVIVGLVIPATGHHRYPARLSYPNPDAPSHVPVLVLALRRCDLGGGFHRCLRNRQVRNTESMAHETHHGEAGEQTSESHIQLPAPTFWPMVLAFGITLLGAGLVTHSVVSMPSAWYYCIRREWLVAQRDSA